MSSYFSPGGLYKGMHENAAIAQNLPWYVVELGSLYYCYIFQKPKAPSLMEVASG